MLANKDIVVELVNRVHHCTVRLEEAKDDKPRNNLMIKYLTGMQDALRDLQTIFLQDKQPWHQVHMMLVTATNYAAVDYPAEEQSYWQGHLEAIREFRDAHKEQFVMEPSVPAPKPLPRE